MQISIKKLIESLETSFIRIQEESYVKEYISLIKNNKDSIRISFLKHKQKVNGYLRLNNILSVLKNPIGKDFQERINYLKSLKYPVSYNCVTERYSDRRTFPDGILIVAWLYSVFNKYHDLNTSKEDQEKIYALYEDINKSQENNPLIITLNKIMFLLNVKVINFSSVFKLSYSTYVHKIINNPDVLKSNDVNKVIAILKIAQGKINNEELLIDINELLSELEQSPLFFENEKEDRYIYDYSSKLNQLLNTIQKNNLTEIDNDLIIGNIKIKSLYTKIKNNKEYYPQEIIDIVEQIEILLHNNKYPIYKESKSNYGLSLFKVFVIYNINQTNYKEIFNLTYKELLSIIENTIYPTKNQINLILNGLEKLNSIKKTSELIECKNIFLNLEDIKDNISSFTVYTEDDINVDDIPIDPELLKQKWYIRALICLSIFKKEQTIPVNAYFEEGALIYKWYKNQKTDYNHNRLDNNQRKIIEMIIHEREKDLPKEISINDIINILNNDLENKNQPYEKGFIDKIWSHVKQILNSKELYYTEEETIELKKLWYLKNKEQSTNIIPNLIITSKGIIDLSEEINYLRSCLNITYTTLSKIINVDIHTLLGTAKEGKRLLDKTVLEITNNLLKELKNNNWRNDQKQDIKRLIEVMKYVQLEREEENNLQLDYLSIISYTNIFNNQEKMMEIICSVKNNNKNWYDNWHQLYELKNQKSYLSLFKYNWYKKNFHLLSLNKLNEDEKILMYFLQYSFCISDEKRCYANVLEIISYIDNTKNLPYKNMTLSDGNLVTNFLQELKKKYFSNQVLFINNEVRIVCKILFNKISLVEKYHTNPISNTIYDSLEYLRISLRLNVKEFTDVLGIKDYEWKYYIVNLSNNNYNRLIKYLNNLDKTKLSQDQLQDIDTIIKLIENNILKLTKKNSSS